MLDYLATVSIKGKQGLSEGINVSKFNPELWNLIYKIPRCNAGCMQNFNRLSKSKKVLKGDIIHIKLNQELSNLIV